jgi:hypothetical protein
MAQTLKIRDENHYSHTQLLNRLERLLELNDNMKSMLDALPPQFQLNTRPTHM